MFPKSGNKLPGKRMRPDEARYASAIREALRGELGSAPAAAKMIMRWTGACDRTVRNWMSGTASPSGYHLICLAQECDAVLAAMLVMSGRSELALAADLHAVEVALAKAAGAFEVLKRQRSANPSS
jgi:hypothetical protein